MVMRDGPLYLFFMSISSTSIPCCLQFVLILRAVERGVLATTDCISILLCGIEVSSHTSTEGVPSLLPVQVPRYARAVVDCACVFHLDCVIMIMLLNLLFPLPLLKDAVRDLSVEKTQRARHHCIETVFHGFSNLFFTTGTLLNRSPPSLSSLLLILLLILGEGDWVVSGNASGHHSPAERFDEPILTFGLAKWANSVEQHVRRT